MVTSLLRSEAEFNRRRAGQCQTLLLIRNVIRRYVMQSPRLPSRYFPEGEAGSRTNPITDPQDLMDMDLLHTRVNGDRHANGVIGGHTPAPPVDRDHPLWGLSASRAAESQTAGRLGGIGVLGAGALGLRGAARMGSTSMGSMGRMGGVGAGSFSASGAGALGRGSAVAGSPALRTGTYSGTGMGTYTPPGSGKAAGGTGQGAAAGQRGGFMGASGAGAAGAKEDKKQRRRKYEAYRVEDEDEDALPRGYVNPLSQTYGTDKDITPARRRNDGWDPNQW